MARRLLAAFLSLVMVFSFTVSAYAEANAINGNATITGDDVGAVETQGHTHTDTCYEEALVCTLPTEAHIHDAGECYGDVTTYICGMDSGEGAHSHGDSCYAEAVLTCTQDEIAGHSHRDSCYETASEPSCGQNSGDGAHTHDNSCYTEKLELSCSDEEEGHEHSSDCYTAISELSCGQKESSGHEHGSGCYDRMQICTQDEIEGHAHGNGCYAAPELVCDLEETEGHIHTSDCEQTAHQLICELSTEPHVHGAECYQKTLICEIETPAEEKSPVEADPVCPGDDTCTIEGCQNHEASAACEECGETNGHAETCSQHEAPSTPAAPACPECGQTEGHSETCITLCTCEIDPEAECPVHPSCPECGVKDGELHLEGCEKYIPVCTCKTETLFHAEDCELYLEPVTAEVYTEADGVYTVIDGHGESAPIDVEDFNGETVYILSCDKPQNLYFERIRQVAGGLLGTYGAHYSIDNEEYAIVSALSGEASENTYKYATITLAANIPSDITIVLTAGHGYGWGEAETINIKVIDEIPEPPLDVPGCDCGYAGDGGLDAHADSCARKDFCKGIGAESAEELAELWEEFPADVQDFILTYLSWTDQEKLEELEARLDGTFEEDVEIEPIDDSVYEVEFSGGEGLTVEVAAPEVAHALKEAPPTSKQHHVTWRGVYDIEAEAGAEITLIGLPEFDSDIIEIRHYLDDPDSVAAAMTNGDGDYLSVYGFEEFFADEIAAVQEADPEADGSTVCYVKFSSEDGDVEITGLEGGAKAVTFYADSYSIYDVAIVFVNPTSYTNAASNGSAVGDSGIVTSKTVKYDENGQYTLQIESYVTGSTTTSTVTTYKPTDFVLSIDISHSMPPCINCGASGIDSTGTGLHGAHSHCEVWAEDLNENQMYYRSENETNSVYYCDTCEGWYSVKHTSESHDGTEYVPKYSNGNTYRRQFYTQEANVNCGDSCTHKAWAHPIYADQLNTAGKYSISSGSSTAANTVIYCDDCGLWYPSNDADHADGDTHASTIYIPYRNASDTNNNGVEFHKSCVSRLQAAKEAVAAFIAQVKEMSKGPDNTYGTDDDIHHRIAIIGFGGDDPGDAKVGVADYQTISGLSKGKYTGTGIYSLYEAKTDEGFGYYSTTNSYNNFQSYYLIKNGGDVATSCYTNALRDVTNATEYAVLEEGTRELNYNYGTYINFAAIMTEQIFEHTYADDERDGVERTRVAVFFTDGQPDGDGEGTYDLADESIQPAYRMKNNVKGEVTVYSIGIFAKADASKIWHLTSDNVAQDEYMHMLSSNYPLSYQFESARKMRDIGATSNRTFTINDVNAKLLKTNADGTVSVDTSKGGYYLTAANAAELTEVFEGIAQDTSIGGASVELDSKTVVQDVVSADWEITVEDGETAASQIQVYTMAYVGEDAWEKSDDTYTPVVSGNTISVTGFNFSENYVGVDYDEGSPTYRGKKLVVVIPINPTESNPGGLAQPTNVRSLSGIYYDTNQDSVLTNDEMEQAFKVPTVDLPTKVTVSKVVENGNAFAESFEFAFDGSYKVPDADNLYNGNDGSDGNYLQMNAADKDEVIGAKLKNGDDFILSEILVGSTLKIRETNAEGYIVKVETNIVPDVSEEDPDDGSGEEEVPNETPGEETGGEETGSETPEGEEPEDNVETEQWLEVTAADDGYYYITVEPGMEIRVTNTLQRADLKIQKAFDGTFEPNQNFIFYVKGKAGTVTEEVDLTVTVQGNGSAILRNLPVGDYTVEEDPNWSWRYVFKSMTDTDETVNGKALELDSDGNIVTVTNLHDDPYWLSGDCYVENWFATDGIKKRNGADEEID